MFLLPFVVYGGSRPGDLGFMGNMFFVLGLYRLGVLVLFGSAEMNMYR